MTLTLEDVKNVRFPIAKRVGEGYRATEVDDFVDQVDATFGTMIEENERLKAQLNSLDASDTRPAPGASAVVVQPANNELTAENERLRAELEKARAAASQAPTVTKDPADEAELQRLRQEVSELRTQLEGTRGELEQARQATGLTVLENNQDGTGRIEKIVVTTAAQASPAVTRLVQLATEQAEAVVSEAQAEADRKIDEANSQAHDLTVDAQTRAERIQSEARVNADQLTAGAQAEAQRVTAEAQANSDALNADVATRRQELFSTLEGERDRLVGQVEHLRTFENTYRSNLVSHFRSQLQVLEGVDNEPKDTPQLLQQAGQQGQPSSTPRLDALLSDGGTGRN